MKNIRNCENEGDEQCVFQPPRQTELDPNWVSSGTSLELVMRGDDLSAAITTPSIEDKDQVVHKLLSGTRENKSSDGVSSFASVDGNQGERPRQKKTSFLLPKIKKTLTTTLEKSQKADFMNLRLEDTIANKGTEKMLLSDPRLLRWQPTCGMNGRPLLPLLECLCSARETQISINQRLRVAFQLQSMQPGGRGSTTMVSLPFSHFVEAIRTIFPDALMRDLKELWHAVEHRPDGLMTIQQLLTRLNRTTASGQRSKSPEPGPAHYDPSYSVVSPRKSSAIISRSVLEPEHVVNSLSTLCMDYDATIKAITPRAPRPVFRKRKFTTSWCNPILKGTPELLPPWSPQCITANQSKSSPRTRISKLMLNVSLPEATTATVTVRSGTIGAERNSQIDKASEWPSTVVKRSQIDACNERTAGKEGDSRAHHALSISDGILSRRSLGSKAASLIPKTSLALSPHTASYRQANLSEHNPFYDDIAPFYAKFFKSTEVKRNLK